MVVISGIRNMMLPKVVSFYCLLNGLSDVIILHDEYKTVHCYEVTNQISLIFCCVYVKA